MQRTVTVNSRRPVGWAHISDLGWGRRPKLHGMQGSGDDRPLPSRPAKVDLVTQPGAERLNGLGRVVLAPVEAAVNEAASATPNRANPAGQGAAADPAPVPTRVPPVAPGLPAAGPPPRWPPWPAPSTPRPARSPRPNIGTVG